MSTNSTEPKVPEYHQSAITMWLRCGRQYMYRHEMDIQIAPRSALTVGSSVGDASDINMIQKIKTKIDLKVGDVMDAFSDAWDKHAPGTDWHKDTAADQKDLGYRLTKKMQESISPNIQPVSVQDKFKIETDEGWNLGGTLDVIDDQGFIRDLKTSKAKYSEDAIKINLQPVMYDFAYEAKYKKKAKGFIYDVVTKHKTSQYQKIVGQVNSEQRGRMFETIRIMHSQIKQGNFQYASENGWWCNKDWCGYWSMCKGKK